MAYPTATIVTTDYTAAATSHAVNLPASIGVGDLLLIWFGCNGSPTVTTPSGWTLKETISIGGDSYRLFSKIASGSEGATVSITISASNSASALALKCPDCTAWGSVSGSDSTEFMAPDAITPEAGILRCLSMSLYGIAGNRPVTEYELGLTVVEDAAADGTTSTVTLWVLGENRVTDTAAFPATPAKLGAATPHAWCTVLLTGEEITSGGLTLIVIED